jgi:hypothetical protein
MSEVNCNVTHEVLVVVTQGVTRFDSLEYLQMYICEHVYRTPRTSYSPIWILFRW